MCIVQLIEAYVDKAVDSKIAFVNYGHGSYLPMFEGCKWLKNVFDITVIRPCKTKSGVVGDVK